MTVAALTGKGVSSVASRGILPAFTEEAQTRALGSCEAEGEVADVTSCLQHKSVFCGVRGETLMTTKQRGYIPSTTLGQVHHITPHPIKSLVGLVSFLRLRTADPTSQDILVLSVVGLVRVLTAEKAAGATQAGLGLGREAVEMTNIAEVHHSATEVGGNFPATPVAFVFHELLFTIESRHCLNH